MLNLTDIEHILSYYDLGELYGVTQSSRGFVNETAFIQTSSGRYVVRRNHRRLGVFNHRYRHALIRRLVEHDFPTPAIMPTRDGDTLLRLDNRFYEIVEFVNGSDYDAKNLRQLDSVGTTLAQYHTIVQNWRVPPDDTPPRYLPQNMMGHIEHLLVRDVMSELYFPLTWYADRTAQLRTSLTEDQYARLPQCVIHGDIHRDNLLFEGDRVVALIDFDQATWDSRIADLADALVGFASARVPSSQMSSWGVFTGPLDVDLSTRLITAYARVMPLTPIELDALPTMIETLWMQAELGRVLSTPEGAPDYHESVLNQGKELSAWMGDHKAQLLSRWNDIHSSVPLGKDRYSPALAA